MAEKKSNYQFRQNLQMVMPVPDFLKKVTGAMKEEKREVDEERAARIAALREQGEQDDEAPQVVVLKSGDLTEEEAAALSKQGYKETNTLKPAFGNRSLKARKDGKKGDDVVYQPPPSSGSSGSGLNASTKTASIGAPRPAKRAADTEGDAQKGDRKKLQVKNKAVLSFADDM